MAQWKCSKCGYQLEEDKPPTVCPDCKETCDFVDITCYVPECGGPESGNTDPRLG